MAHAGAWAPVGRYLPASVPVHEGTSGVQSGTSHGDGVLFVMAHYVPFDFTVDEIEIALYDGATTGATGNWRVVIYDTAAPESAMYPGAKLYESANVAVDPGSSPVVTTITGVNTTLKAGRMYWIGVITDTTVANPTYRNLGNIVYSAISVLGDDPTRTDLNPVRTDLSLSAYKSTGHSFPAPDTFPGGATIVTDADELVLIMLKRG